MIGVVPGFFWHFRDNSLGMFMANQFELVLQKNYEELQLRGKSGCYFVDVDDEGRFRSLVEKFCREHSIDNAVRLQILPSNLSDPLILIV